MMTWMWTQLRRLLRRETPPPRTRVTYYPGGAHIVMRQDPRPGDALCFPFWTDDA